MRLKNTLILFGIFLALLAGVIILNKREKAQQALKDAADKVLAIKKEAVTEILLQPAGIRAEKEGDQWKIKEPIETDGDESAIESIISSFDYARTERVVSEDTTEFSEYGLAPPRGEIEIVAGDKRERIFIGDKNPTGAYVFARKNNNPAVFLTISSLSNLMDKTLFDLRDKRILMFEKDSVQRIHLVSQAGEFVMARSGNDWALETPIKTESDQATIEKILDQTDNARAREFVGEGTKNLETYGLTNALVQLNLFLGANLRPKTLRIGRANADRFYAKDEARDEIFLVDSSFVRALRVNLFDLRNKNINQFTSTDVDSIILTFANQNVVCVKDSGGNWNIKAPAQRKAKSWKISSLTGDIASLKVTEFVDDNPVDLARYGLAKPRARVQFFSKISMLTDILIGNEKGENVYVKLSSRPAVFSVKKDIYLAVTPKLDDIAEQINKLEEEDL